MALTLRSSDVSGLKIEAQLDDAISEVPSGKPLVMSRSYPRNGEPVSLARVPLCKIGPRSLPC